MYITTFYSFKGGVGRTLALMNVAVELASQGRRVLIVDFDLEAPGLSSFELCKNAVTTPGVVEFVQFYIENHKTPDIRDFISECPLERTSGSGALFVMPAGRLDDAYGRKLASIDWISLYKRRHGFLMIEDMRAQWGKTIQPDYVFIDSRTGHTEEGGICTRQLPDAVVAMFFPNEQNLVGLRKVIRDIRREDRARDRSTNLHFVISNVPDIDDEDLILSERLAQFREQLNYDNALRIHHYSSLALLNQEIFVLKRSRSRLAKEYCALSGAIIEQNPADLQGALHWLEGAAARLTMLAGSAKASQFDQLLRIIEHHPRNSDVVVAAAAVYRDLWRAQDALNLLEPFIEQGEPVTDVLRQHAMASLLIGNTEQAVADLLRVLNADDAKEHDVTFAIAIISSHDMSQLRVATTSKAFRKLSPEQQNKIGLSLMDRQVTIDVAETIFRRLFADGLLVPQVRINLSLCLMYQQNFQAVMSILGPRTRLFESDVQLPDIFNFAMAEWASTGYIPVDIFTRFLESLPNREPNFYDVNTHQCKSIALCAVGRNSEARESLDETTAKCTASAGQMFSAWRYRHVSKNEMREDLRELLDLIDGKAISPRFMRPLDRTVH